MPIRPPLPSSCFHPPSSLLRYILTSLLLLAAARRSASAAVSSSSSSTRPPRLPRMRRLASADDDLDSAAATAEAPPVAAPALVVCGVDGTVYVLDAQTGHLRGLFGSGGALVGSGGGFGLVDEGGDEGGWQSSPSSSWGDDDDYGDSLGREDEEDSPRQQPPAAVQERIVPGLDGHLYALTTTSSVASSSGAAGDDDSPSHGTLDPLPISVMDVVESPVSTCRPDGRRRRGRRSFESDVVDDESTLCPEEGEEGSCSRFDAEGLWDEEDEEWYDQEEERCGVVMGSKRTTLYALDTSTGTVRWIQQPSDNGNSGRTSFTSSSSTMGGRTGRESGSRQPGGSNVVLLQREDYTVRHVDAETGEEAWNVTVGRFSALDFASASSSSKSRQRRPPGGPRSRASSAAAAGGGTKGGTGASTVGLLPSPRLEGNGHIGDDGKGNPPIGGDAPHLLALPSVAFGEDGTSVLAVDGMSGDLLWKRRIESVVAAVYGVGGTGDRWVSLDVVDEQDVIRRHYHQGHRASIGLPVLSSNEVDNHKHKGSLVSFNNGPLPSGKPTDTRVRPSGGTESTSLVPFNNGQKKRRQARLGRHSSTLFVASSMHSHEDDFHPYEDWSLSANVPMLDSSPFIADNTSFPSSPGPTEQKILPSADPSAEPLVTPPARRPATWNTTHKTEGGLFITWRMVTVLVGTLFGVALCGRMAYLRQKRKWIAQGTPLLVPTAPNSSDDKWVGSSSPTHPYSPRTFSSPSVLSLGVKGAGDLIPLRLPETEHSRQVSAPLDAAQSKPVVRSLSMPQMFMNSRERNVISEKGNDCALMGSAHPDKSRDSNQGGVKAWAQSFLPDLRATTTGTKTAPTNASSTTDAEKAQQSDPVRVHSIDGIPLVRYSRYTSEFNELSALGKGGFGTVFRCTNALDGRAYAVKKVRIASYVDSTGKVTKQFSAKLHRVLREVKILAKLDHPNIVRYYTAWLEQEDDSADEEGSVGQAMTRCSFSELGGVGSTDLRSDVNSSTWRQPRTLTKSSFIGGLSSSALSPSRGLYGNRATANPLGWNNFFLNTEGSKSASGNKSDVSGRKFQGSALRSSSLRSSSSSLEDLGFTWERSGSDLAKSRTRRTQDLQSNELSTINASDEESGISECDSDSSSDSSGEDTDSSVTSETQSQLSSKTSAQACTDQKDAPKKGSADLLCTEKAQEEQALRSQKHILYIQMQLCSQKTLADFLGNSQARKGLTLSRSSTDGLHNTVDIPYALRMFSQIAKGVKHVHQQGLIHRDLKPSNCFIDDSGNVKVGDFGLSRESSATGGIDKIPNQDRAEYGSIHRNSSHQLLEKGRDSLGYGDDNTAGVGTRSYASPEQMSGSDYDASSDVYSLGVMLFELCYPMYTGMERYTVFNGIRAGNFPEQWHTTVAKSFPSLHMLLVTMLSKTPSKRPTSAAVADQIDALLAEYTVISLDRSRHHDGSLLIRVEASDGEGILSRTTKIIKEASSHVTILQYGLRGQESKAIMEFALTLPDGTKSKEMKSIFSKLNESDEIKVVRQVTGKHAATVGGSSGRTD